MMCIYPLHSFAPLLFLSMRLMHIYRHDSGRGVSDLLEFNGVVHEIYFVSIEEALIHISAIQGYVPCV